MVKKYLGWFDFWGYISYGLIYLGTTKFIDACGNLYVGKINIEYFAIQIITGVIIAGTGAIIGYKFLGKNKFR